MRKRLLASLLAIILLFSVHGTTAFACDEEQTNTYVVQILFGNNPINETDKNVKMLMNALYLCSEQSDGRGQEKLDYLKVEGVSSIPKLFKLDVKEDELLECSHNSWEYKSQTVEKEQEERKELLQDTVNKVFDFGVLNNWFRSGGEKCDSFAALLYYSHILSDYLADSPNETEVNMNGKMVPSYTGKASIIINGDKPSFSASQKKSTASFCEFSQLDKLGRAGVAIANIGPDIMPPSNSRQDIGMIKPSGWNQNKYSGFVNSNPPYLYNRCHLIAHQLVGEDSEINLITGTRYLNIDGMKSFEDDVAEYIWETNNHVLYRATPIYKGDNKLASGVQLEAYSVEDSGAGICFNRYCYNVQPGIDLNYINGENGISDIMLEAEGVLPFAVQNASEDNPDLIFEVNKHLEVLFIDQKNTKTYIEMSNKITSIANDARRVVNVGADSAKGYIEMKGYEYQYLEVLRSYIPALLKKEDFFKSAFE
ncbi:MAG: DNA/RNA non-specific endonuclease [Eubacterium sp.]|nr:DNA/RNA non-specific endonuclease [Eubacterium sp.]